MKGERTHVYAAAIVLNLEQLHSTIFNSNANRCSTSIQAIFKQFLQRRSRSMYDLPNELANLTLMKNNGETYLSCGYAIYK
jgi:hypothetical protein